LGQMVLDTSLEIARGLIGVGIEPGDRVSILGLTSADWTLADCGSLCAGAVVTPIYQTNSAEECAYVLGHSEARLVFCDEAEQAAKIAQIRDRCPSLEHVVLFVVIAFIEFLLLLGCAGRRVGRCKARGRSPGTKGQESPAAGARADIPAEARCRS
jgi:acyl-CoA synthetase (AMP-forming)/AMP-acid ligase II